MALSIPIWARPLAPPPLNVSPIFGLFGIELSRNAGGAGEILDGNKLSCALTSEKWINITQPVISSFRTEIKNGSLLIVEKVCYKIKQRKYGILIIVNVHTGIQHQMICFKFIVHLRVPLVSPVLYHNVVWQLTNSMLPFYIQIQLPGIFVCPHIYQAPIIDFRVYPSPAEDG